MAAGCVPDALPWDIPLIAHQAGFQSSGMWLDTSTTWDNNALSKTKESLEKTDIQLIDIEVTWLENDDILSDNHKAELNYTIFLDRFPEHELAPSVQFELDYLGKDINEIDVLKHITS